MKNLKKIGKNQETYNVYRKFETYFFVNFFNFLLKQQKKVTILQGGFYLVTFELLEVTLILKLTVKIIEKIYSDKKKVLLKALLFC